MNFRKVIILGSGPAGYTASIYSIRANLPPYLFTGSTPGGQLTTTTDVENWPGGAEGLTGPELMDTMKEHAVRAGVDCINEHVDRVDLSSHPYKVYVDKNVYSCFALIIATGANAKYLGLESEQRLLGKGVSACATCDGFFYRNQEVAVVGGGNTAVEEALYLAKIASKVYLVHRREELRAEMILQDRLTQEINMGKIVPIYSHVVDEILGEDVVSGLRLKHVNGEIVKELNVAGVFIAIGHNPNTSLFESQLDMDQGYLRINHDEYYTQTSKPGIYAAGDVSDSIYRQAITSAGSGCMAALDAVRYINTSGQSLKIPASL